MADSILRLKVESQEYDQKIKRAAEGIQQYAQKCREVGGTLEHLDEGVLDFVKALGQMDTVASNSKQQLREMSNALTTLTSTYRGLTDEEKASPFGQELAKGIDMLTERAGQIQDTMGDVQASIRNTASDTRVFDQVAGGVTILTSTMQTAQGAAKLLGIELGDNVEVLAKLQAAMAVTSGLQQMQNLLQKQSALMQGINILQKEFNLLAKANPYVLLASAVAAAAGAYLVWSKNGESAKKVQESLNSELENTKNQLQQIDKDTDFSVGIAEASGKSWKAIHELRLEAARTKLQLADMNYDKLFASGASADQMKEAAQMQKNAWENVMKVLNEGTTNWAKNFYGGGKSGKGKSGGVKEDTNYAADSIMAQEKEVQRLTDAWNRASGAMRDGILKDLDQAKAKLEAMKAGAYDAGEIGDVTVTGNKNRQLGKSVSQENIGSYIGNINSAIQSSEMGSTLFNKLTENLADANAFKNLLTIAVQNGIDTSEFDTNGLWKKIVNGENIDSSVWESLQNFINEKLGELGIDPIQINFKTGGIEKVKQDGEATAKSMQKAAGAIGQVSSALNSIENPAAKIIGTIGQAIATIALAYAENLAGDDTTKGNIWAFIAAAAATAVSLAATIASVHSSTGYAEGGIIKGNSFSGDMIPADSFVNAGELVLNRAQQGALASMIRDNERNGGGSGVSYITGEQICVVIDRYLARTGRGELVTWK